MGSIIDADKAGTSSDETRFIAKALQVLDSSLTELPPNIEVRLDCARLAALLQARVPGSDNGATARGFAAALESDEGQIPESVRLRLDSIRAGAMQRASAAQQAQGPWWRRWAPQGFAVPASAFASLCILVTTLAIFNLSGAPETMPLVVAENSLVLASEAEIELYENLEFYQWLADNGL